VTGEYPKTEFAFPGPLRDRLVAAVLRGEKTATCWLLAESEEGSEPMPEPGDRWSVVDSDDKPVGVIETLDVRVMRMGDVDLQIALDEGEGFESVADWRAQHEDFWRGYRDDVLDDDTLVVVERFRLVR
jgi:uncharacterized protein YhfF